MAELVDAWDLKSQVFEMCGFDSHYAHYGLMAELVYAVVSKATEEIHQSSSLCKIIKLELRLHTSEIKRRK